MRSKQTKTITDITDLQNIFQLSYFFFIFFLKFTKLGKTMNTPLFLSILMALVCAELVFSYRLKSLAKDKMGGMSDDIKAALQADKGQCKGKVKFFGGYPRCVDGECKEDARCETNSDCCCEEICHRTHNKFYRRCMACPGCRPTCGQTSTATATSTAIAPIEEGAKAVPLDADPS